MQSGIYYRDTYREERSLGEYDWYWLGDDGSVLEYTEEEKRERAERDGPKSLAD